MGGRCDRALVMSSVVGLLRYISSLCGSCSSL